jgi:hypothetical protein
MVSPHPVPLAPQETEILGTLGLMLFQKWRRSAGNADILIEKFFLYAKTAILVLTYHFDGRITCWYAVLFTGERLASTYAHARAGPSHDHGPLTPHAPAT